MTLLTDWYLFDAKLYVFTLKGSYCGGLVGIVSDSPEGAIKIALADRELYEQWDLGKSERMSVATCWFEGDFFLSESEVGEMDKRYGYYVLTNTFELRQPCQPGIMFCELFDG